MINSGRPKVARTEVSMDIKTRLTMIGAPANNDQTAVSAVLSEWQERIDHLNQWATTVAPTVTPITLRVTPLHRVTRESVDE